MFEQLVRNLSPGQAPLLRIGGDSTDISYVPAKGVKPPAYVGYQLTPSWMGTTRALCERELGAKLILGINLAANEPALGAAEARAYVKALGRGSIEALEIGNEPNLYAGVTRSPRPSGKPVAARPKSFGFAQFAEQFDAIAKAMPRLPLAAPALAAGPGRGHRRMGRPAAGLPAPAPARVGHDRASLPAGQLLLHPARRSTRRSRI